jgi:hypothetical protein
MITEFLWLTLLTLNENEREALRGRFDEWLKCFLPKLKIESTRTAKCRLLASVERHEFGKVLNAANWRFCKFDGNEGILFDQDRKQLEEFEATSFQKKILRENPDLSNIFIGRSEIMEENGKWQLLDGLKEKIISEGGEAIVFSEKFGESEFAVRVQIFDPFLFTTMFAANQIKWKTHLISGKNYNFYESKSFKISELRSTRKRIALRLSRFTKILFEISRILNFSMPATKKKKTVSAGLL